MIRWILRKVWIYLTTRLIVTPLDGIPGISNKTNIYMEISNGLEAVQVSEALGSSVLWLGAPVDPMGSLVRPF